MIDPRQQAALRNRRWFRYSLLLLSLLLALMTAALGIVYALWPEHHAPAVTVLAQPTAAPTGAHARVVMNTTPDLSHSMTIIPSNTTRFFCIADLPDAAPSASLYFKFQKMPAAQDYFDLSLAAGAYRTAAKFVYLDGPLQPGKWRCQVSMNGVFFGSAPFTVQ